MDCRNIKELIVRYSSGDLPGSDRELVEVHVEECEECRAYLSRSYKLWDLLGEWQAIETGTGYVSDFWDRVSREKDGRRGFFGRLREFRPNWTLAGALATVLIVGIFTFAVFGPESGYRGFSDRDEQDELILLELDRATSRDTAEVLAIYGPWENDIDVVNINGDGGMN